jgi:hypothetical protein
LNIVKTTKIYESAAAISEVGGSFSDLSLWAFWKESGVIKTKVIFKDQVLDTNGFYVGSLTDIEWSEVETLSNNTDDHYPSLYMTGDDSGILLWGRSGELLIMPDVVLKDLLSGNFNYRYSAPVSPAAPLSALGDIDRVVAYWVSPTNRNLEYLLYTRINDETSWTEVEKYANIPNADGENILHLRVILYSKLTKGYFVPEIDQILLIYICDPENRLTWDETKITGIIPYLTVCGLYLEDTYYYVEKQNQLEWK